MTDAAEPGLGFAPPAPKAAAEPYRVLARKYRPQDFGSLIGQDALVRTLGNAFATGRIAHAFMLTGVRGVGKTTTARIVARALNCIGADGSLAAPTITPCGVCANCVAIAESRHVDVFEMDAASRTGIDDVREIIEGARYLPVAARTKVYIIDEVHMLSKQAFNGLLKTLEEPPPHVKFIFATTEIRKVPVTVLSRCQRFDLKRIESQRLVEHLASICAAEGVAAEPAALALVARAAEGSVRDSLSILDQAIAHGEGAADSARITEDAVRRMLGLADRTRVLGLYRLLMEGRIAEALAELRAQYDEGAEPLVVVQELMEITHWLTRLLIAPAAEGDPAATETERTEGRAMAGRLTVPSLARVWQLLLKGIVEVREAVHPIAAAEMLLVRIAYAADLPPTDELVRRVQAERGQPQPVSASAPPAGPGSPRASAHASPHASMAPGQGGRPVHLASVQAAAVPAATTATSPLATPAMPAPAPVPEAEMQEAAAAAPSSFADVAMLAGEKGEFRLRYALENDVHLVRFEPGRIELRLTPRAGDALPRELGQKLTAWTGMRWVVAVSQAAGAPTIAAGRMAERDALMAEAMGEPLVQAALKVFPGAVLRGVRDVFAAEAGPDSDADDAPVRSPDQGEAP